MRAIRLRKPGGLERLELGGAELPPVHKGEIRVRLHASSLNYHDYFVVMGKAPTPDGRIPMSDGAGTLTQSIVACRLRGHIGLIGVLAGFAGEVPTAAIMRGNVRISGLTVGSREQQLAMIRALEANRIKPVIDSSFPLEGIADAFRRQESGRHFGKICLEW